MDAKYRLLMVIALQAHVMVNITHGLPLEATTTLGAVIGARFEAHDAFLGVPYARPPVGDLRWRNPQPRESWYPEVLIADTQPPGCIQDCFDPDFHCPAEISEDCLYLNIYRPSYPKSEGLLPVYVFLHGGQFHSGACSATLYNGEYMALAMDAIVVCVNYRLGALGFLYLGTSDPETGEEILGSFGLEDQLAALKFLRDNLRSFGGDPNQVTLAGQSAGAESIAFHMRSPEADDLFQKAILYSHPMSLPVLTPEEGALLGDHFASLLACQNDTLTCLRSKTADEIRYASMDCQSFVPNESRVFETFQIWGPVVGIGPVEAFEMGMYKERPIIMGTTSEEGRAYAFTLFENPLPSFLYTLAITMILPENADEVLAEYPADPAISDQRELVSQIGTDYVFICPNLHVAKLMSLQHDVDVYHYEFDQAFSSPEGWGEYEECYGHVCHGGDLPYIFGTAEDAGFSYSKGEKELIDRYWEYISSFIRTGNPNYDKSNIYWPSIGEIRGGWSTQVLSSDYGIRNETNWKEEDCQFWDAMGYYDIPKINK